MKVGILGCAGRMGRMLVQEVLNDDACELVGGSEVSDSVSIGIDIAAYAGLPECGINISKLTGSLFAESDVVIDFTLPTATLLHLELAQANNTNLILGTTGHDDKGLHAIEKATENIAIVKAMNFSIGVNVLFALTEQLSSILGDDYDVEILEMHHKHKIDVPSGTAIGLGEAAAKGRGVNLDSVAARGRDGIVGARKKGEIGFASLRGGEVVGDHSIIFAGENERVELFHKASSRGIFSKGAVRAAHWVDGQTSGLYNMLDVLGLR